MKTASIKKKAQTHNILVHKQNKLNPENPIDFDFENDTECCILELTKTLTVVCLILCILFTSSGGQCSLPPFFPSTFKSR